MPLEKISRTQPRTKIVNTDTTIKVKTEKKRVNITISPFLWDELGKKVENKSAYIESLLKEIIEDEKGKKIIDIPRTRKW